MRQLMDGQMRDLDYFEKLTARTDPDGTITGVSTEWSRTNRHEFGSAIGTEDNFDEDQVDVLTAVYRMNQ